MMSDIVIYQEKDGKLQLNINVEHDTLWLSQQQIADLFGTKRQAITKHLKNIFQSGELEERNMCSILEHMGQTGQKYKTKVYALDAVISVGYRVNSHQATRFRIWATDILKEHIFKGYSLNKTRIAQKGLQELQLSIALLQKTLTHNQLVSEIGEETIKLIVSYAKTWHLLLAYDEGKLNLPHAKKSKACSVLNYEDAKKSINALKLSLLSRHEASELFGHERSPSFAGILGNIEQTFDGKYLYKTSEEKAAHLLYFIIKDHPFTDGNKRIGCLMFLIFLRINNIPIAINDNGLVALALLIAESEPQQKEFMVRLIVNLLTA